MPKPPGPPGPNLSGTVSYRAGTEDELRDASRARRVLALADQRRLFPHQGVLELGADAMLLHGWRQLTRAQITGIELTFTAAYSRLLAAGARGNSPSFGAFGSLGKPLVLGVAGEPSVYLLLGYLVVGNQPKPQVVPTPHRLGQEPRDKGRPTPTMTAAASEAGASRSPIRVKAG